MPAPARYVAICLSPGMLILANSPAGFGLNVQNYFRRLTFTGGTWFIARPAITELLIDLVVGPHF